jgi:hypothetical protein
MAIRCLAYVVYDESGWGWHEEKVASPSEAQVEASIRRLDKFRYPWIWLFIGDDEDPTEDCLTVMGGDGVYWIALSAGKHDQLRLFDPDKSNNIVHIWTSDQGFWDYEFHTTSDIDLVLHVVRHFGETGEPLPSATWEV